jgi:hypothetical protein
MNRQGAAASVPGGMTKLPRGLRDFAQLERILTTSRSGWRRPGAAMKASPRSRRPSRGRSSSGAEMRSFGYWK